MNTIKTCRFASIASSAALLVALVAPAAALAGDGDEHLFDFRLDPVVFELLFTDVNTNSSKFEEYRDMDSDALIRRFRLIGESRDRDRVFDLDVMNAGRADARYTMRYGNSGRYSVLFDYNVIPHRFGNDGRILHSIFGAPGVLSISDTTQQTLQDAIDAAVAGSVPINYTFLQAQLQPFIDTATVISPALERKRSRALIEVGKLSTMSWTIDLKQETREGSRPYGGTFGFNNAIELPEPIDYNTVNAEISGEWKGRRGGARFGASVSSFQNDVDTLIYDSPWRLVDATADNAYIAPSSSAIEGPSRGRNALSPDNRAGQAYVSGHARLGQSGWFNGQVSFGQMKQDEPLLPHTINTAINNVNVPLLPFDDASLLANRPATSADADVKTLHVTANAGTKIGKKGSVKFRARYYDYDNRSPMISMPGYVRMDAVWEDIPRITVPYEYTKQKVGVEFGYDPSTKTHLAFGYDLESWDREFREIDGSDEDIFHFTIDSRASDRVTFRGGWEYGDRSTDPYATEAQLLSFTDPLREVDNLFELRKYDEAEREYDAGHLSAVIMASDAVSVTLGASLRDDEYGDSGTYGLVSEELLQYSAEVGYTPHERLSFFLFGHFADRESFQKARDSGGSVSPDPEDDWSLTLTEDTLTAGLGLNARISDLWRVDVSGSWSDSDGDSEFSAPVGGATPISFDEYDDNEWMVYRARFGVTASEHVDMGINLIREEFVTNRFQRDGLMPYLRGTLVLDANDGDYDANILALDMTISF
ncbi:MAG: MtrB/PioB family outer membrane beta-barrel protein [Acidobacteriota bacterium]|nr:MtrB/PioB family outer membrane beta-barrel protein [Acidobacteriota bacterium]